MEEQEVLSSLISDCSSDILVLTETWLSSNMSDNDVLPLSPEYRQDRLCRRRGGGSVLIGIRYSIQSTRVDMAPCSLEMCWVSLIVLIGVFYRPPDSVNIVPALDAIQY